MTDETGAGEEIRARRTRAGMDLQDLARMAGVSRTTLTALERGQEGVRPATVGKVRAALDRFEEEAGLSDPQPTAEPGQVTFELSSGMGIAVTVKGPVENLAELREEVARLLETMEHRRSE